MFCIFRYQLFRLTYFVFVFVPVKPTSVAILKNSSHVSAGKGVEIVCQALGGYPPPKITWWLGSKRLKHEHEASIFLNLFLQQVNWFWKVKNLEFNNQRPLPEFKLPFILVVGWITPIPYVTSRPCLKRILKSDTFWWIKRKWYGSQPSNLDWSKPPDSKPDPFSKTMKNRNPGGVIQAQPQFEPAHQSIMDI